MKEIEKPKQYDTRVSLRVPMEDIPFIKHVCNVFDVKYQTISTEGKPYPDRDFGPHTLPEGMAWIKMRAKLEAGQGFDFITNLARDIKNFTKEQ